MWRLSSFEEEIFRGLQTGRGWGDTCLRMEEEEDNQFLHISEKEFNAIKLHRKVNKHFQSWNDWLTWARRIEKKRIEARKPKLVTSAPQKDMVSSLLSLRQDYINTPNIYFKDEAEQQYEIRKLEQDIAKIPSGKWRLQLVREKEIQRDKPIIDSVIQKVKRSVQAIQFLKREIAATKIQQFFRVWNRPHTCTKCSHCTYW